MEMHEYVDGACQCEMNKWSRGFEDESATGRCQDFNRRTLNTMWFSVHLFMPNVCLINTTWFSVHLFLPNVKSIRGSVYIYSCQMYVKSIRGSVYIYSCQMSNQYNVVQCTFIHAKCMSNQYVVQCTFIHAKCLINTTWFSVHLFMPNVKPISERRNT
jgi:hypothetical protein